MSGPKNIFISHYGKDDEYLHQLKQRLNDQGFEVRNYSVDSTNHKGGRKPRPEVVERLLRLRMHRSSTVIVLIGPETHSREWVNWEIELAHKLGKQVVGVYMHGCKDKVPLPDALQKYAISTIGWNSIDRLGRIINGEEVAFEEPGGGVAFPLFSPSYESC